MDRILIVAAFKSELKSLFKHLNVVRKLGLAQGTLHVTEQADLLISGMGSERCKKALNLYLNSHSPGIILNAGIAGALQEGLDIGEIYLVDRFAHGKEILLPAYLNLLNHFSYPKTGLLTVDNPVLCRNKASKIYQESGQTLVDMEAYHLARIAAERDIPFISLKVVSDSADPGTIEHIKNHINKYADILSRVIMEIITDENLRNYSRV